MNQGRILLVLYLVAAAAACGTGGSGGEDPAAGAPGGAAPAAGDAAAADACKQYDCSNPIDAVIIPRIAALGLKVTKEADDVLCRRLAIDLTGAVPTGDEQQTACAGRSAREIATYFMNKPTNAVAVDGSSPYVFVNRRSWSATQQIYDQLLENEYYGTFFVYKRLFDELVSDLYSGKIGYDVFARRALGSPAFFKQWAKGTFETYDLVAVAAAAYRTFLGRAALPSEAEDFGELWRAWGAIASSDPRSGSHAYAECPGSTLPGYGPCVHLDVGLYGQRCADAAPLGCSSNVLGAGRVLPSKATFVPYLELTGPDLEAVETPGRLVAARPEFPQVAVDLALHKYLGWWKDGTFVPDYEIPAVRDAAAKQFVADAYDVRKLDMMIVTSVLYTQAQTREQTTNLPIWAFGPTKRVPAVTWLDDLGLFGAYDFRYRDNLTPPDHFKPYSGERIPNQKALGDTGGLNSVFAQRSVLLGSCSAKGVAPDATLDSLVDRAFVHVGRAATTDERSTLLTQMQAPGLDGCPVIASCDRGVTAIALCRSLYATAPFNFY